MADHPHCVAEFLTQVFQCGQRVGVAGRLRVRDQCVQGGLRFRDQLIDSGLDMLGTDGIEGHVEPFARQRIWHGHCRIPAYQRPCGSDPGSDGFRQSTDPASGLVRRVDAN